MTCRAVEFTSPLHWPSDWPRTALRQRARFDRKLDVQAAYRQLAKELGALGALDVVMSSNARPDGSDPRDPGFAVYFAISKALDPANPGKPRATMPVVLACDCWDRLAHNVRAVALHVEALRGLERWGVGKLERFFSGYAALPAAGQTSSNGWDPRLVLGLDPRRPIVAGDVTAAFARAVMTAHPDKGGTTEQFQRAVRARDELLQTVPKA